MAWVTWVTWVFVALAALVAVIAWAITSGRLHVGFEDPYPREDESPQMPESVLGHSGVEWTEPAAGRPDLAGTEPAEGGATDLQHHPRTTGEPADGRYEAQDR